MQTIILQYDSHNALIESILNSAILAGAKVVEPEKKPKEVSSNGDILTAYQKMFGKRKDNKYTENEIFVFNSMLNVQKILERYED